MSHSIILNAINVRVTSCFYSLRIAHVAHITRDALAVTFEVPSELRERFYFTQGQYVTLRVQLDGEEVRRSYSICATPYDEMLRIAIKRVPGGRFSTWAHATLVPGAIVEVGPPEGHFYVALNASTSRHYVGFAGGSGITPLLSLIATTLLVEPHSRFTLVYANRSWSSVMFGDELLDLKDRYLERLSLLFVMSREPQEVDVFHGRVDLDKCTTLFAGWIDVSTLDVAFLCGPQPIVDAASQALCAHGFPAEQIKTELFTAGPRTALRPRMDVETEAAPCIAYAVLDGQRRTFMIEKGGETVLDAGLRHGLDLPYSCKGGVCSTCRVRLLEGEVDMDVHYALEDYEIARGFVLTCQSYPLTDTIGIDVDSHSRV